MGLSSPKSHWIAARLSKNARQSVTAHHCEGDGAAELDETAGWIGISRVMGDER